MTGLDNRALRKIAELYCQIWKESPWYEDFWKPEEVMADIKKELLKGASKGFIATKDGEVVGFTWGYEVTKEDLREISKSNLLDYLFDVEGTYFYVDELGVDIAFRGRGLGELLSRSLIKDLQLTCLLTRTDIKAQKARALYENLGFSDLRVKDTEHPNRTYWLRPVS